MSLSRLRGVLAATLVVALSCTPTASAEPTSPLCKDGSYREAHPLICDSGTAAPGQFPGGGGPRSGGGLLGVVGRVVGGLTGGLL
jgi:hypothetical protein